MNRFVKILVVCIAVGFALVSGWKVLAPMLEDAPASIDLSSQSLTLSQACEGYNSGKPSGDAADPVGAVCTYKDGSKSDASGSGFESKQTPAEPVAGSPCQSKTPAADDVSSYVESFGRGEWGYTVPWSLRRAGNGTYVIDTRMGTVGVVDGFIHMCVTRTPAGLEAWLPAADEPRLAAAGPDLKTPTWEPITVHVG